MFCPEYSAPLSGSRQFPTNLLIVMVGTLLAAASFIGFPAFGQTFSFQREIETPETVSVVVRNRDGRVSVIASEEQQKKVTIEGRSAGLPVDPGDISAEAKG